MPKFGFETPAASLSAVTPSGPSPAVVALHRGGPGALLVIRQDDKVIGTRHLPFWTFEGTARISEREAVTKRSFGKEKPSTDQIQPFDTRAIVGHNTLGAVSITERQESVDDKVPQR